MAVVLFTRELPAHALLSTLPPCVTMTPAEGQLSCASFSSRKAGILAKAASISASSPNASGLPPSAYASDCGVVEGGVGGGHLSSGGGKSNTGDRR